MKLHIALSTIFLIVFTTATGCFVFDNYNSFTDTYLNSFSVFALFNIVLLAVLTAVRNNETRCYFIIVLVIIIACFAEAMILSQEIRSADDKVYDIPYYFAFSESMSSLTKFFWHFLLGAGATAITVLLNMPWTQRAQEEF